MSEPTVLDGGHLSEFVGGYTGICGETALAVALAAANYREATPQDILDITAAMRAAGLAEANGASTLAGLAAFAKTRSAVVEQEYPYQADNFPGVDWANLLLSFAGHAPMVLQLANGQALSDAVTGAHDESGVKYHFIAVLGRTVGGAYLCADGDNPQATTGYETYTEPDLAAAQPCALLILKMGVKTVALPTGYQDINGAAVAPNGFKVVGAIRALWEPYSAFAGDPLEDEHATDVAGVTEQRFYGCVLGTKPDGTAYVAPAGQLVADLRADDAAKTASLADAAKAEALAAAIKAFL